MKKNNWCSDFVFGHKEKLKRTIDKDGMEICKVKIHPIKNTRQYRKCNFLKRGLDNA